jgi:predicted SprT family Zn-dependent metalloprotease
VTVTEPKVLTMQDIQQLALAALEEHGLMLQGWGFQWDNAVKRAGLCSFRNKQIQLSRAIYGIEANREHALDTILHEVAHALAGPGAGHGPAWKRIARQIGARPERCYSTSEITPPKGKIVGTCACGSIHRRHRAVKPGTGHLCRLCRSRVTWEVAR